MEEKMWQVLVGAIFLGLCTVSAQAQIAERTGDIIGTTEYYTVTSHDASVENPRGFEKIARRHEIGYLEMLAVNLEHVRLRDKLPMVEAGVTLMIPKGHIIPVPPSDRKGIVINLSEMRLYYFPEGTDQIFTYPVGIGDEGTNTPLGRTTIVKKRVNPTWNIPQSILSFRVDRKAKELVVAEHISYPAALSRARVLVPRSVPPGPDNPLGAFALNFAPYSVTNDGLIRLHGTKDDEVTPFGIGRRVSHGCLRMYPEHIERLFPLVSSGTPVLVMDDPLKLGWRDNKLYLEVHADQLQANSLETAWVPVLGTSDGKHSVPDFLKKPIPNLRERVLSAAGEQGHRIDWRLVEEIAEERWGVPVLILDLSAESTEKKGI